MWDDSALELWDDPAPGRWIVDLLPPIALDVRSLLPDGFEAYARIFHPASTGDIDGGTRSVRWGTIAEVNRRTIHPEVQWSHLAGVPQASALSVPGLWDDAPDEGRFPQDELPRLAEMLADHTETLDPVWFAVWDGWGGLRIRPDDAVPHVAEQPRKGVVKRAFKVLPFHPIESRRQARRIGPQPTLLLPNREYHILRGPLEAAVTSLVYPPSWQSPNVWWPEDRAWCVATEIDLNSTYVGGSRACIEDLVYHPGMEVIEVPPTAGITDDSDQINPPPPFFFE